jgi:hypothetical protein
MRQQFPKWTHCDPPEVSSQSVSVYPMLQTRGNPAMSEETLRAIRELAKSVDRNTPRIKKALAKRGKKADAALVFIAAQYFDCLNRLAKK